MPLSFYTFYGDYERMRFLTTSRTNSTYWSLRTGR